MNKDQEEFDKLIKKIYALADKMGQRLTITVRRKSPAEVAHLAGNQKPAPREHFEKSSQREPGDE